MVGLLILRVVGHGRNVWRTRPSGSTSARYATRGSVVASITPDAPLEGTDPGCYLTSWKPPCCAEMSLLSDLVWTW
jgi:hypothetical protein